MLSISVLNARRKGILMDINIPLGRYRHYKGHIYKVTAIARHTETLEPMVVYESIGGDSVWVRPARMWFDEIEYNGKKCKRFEELP